MHTGQKRRCLSTDATNTGARDDSISFDESQAASLKRVSSSPGLRDLRALATQAFPTIPASLWKNSFYYVLRHQSGKIPTRIGLHDIPRPSGGKRYPVSPGGLSPYKRPPPGLDVFTITLDRQAFRAAKYEPHIRRLLRVQFASCTTATDVLRVVALAMQRKMTMKMLPRAHLRLIQALFRCRDRISDQRVCSVIRIVIQRLHKVGLPVPYELYTCGIKFAARSRSLEKFRWFLVQFKLRGIPVSRNLFRSIIAKCGIGTRGFGEIRNGKWNPDDLRQALLGFDDAKTEVEKHAHLGSWLLRRDWQAVHAWWQILSVIGAQDILKEEWKIWKNDMRIAETPAADAVRDKIRLVLVKGKADSSFLRTMLRFGDTKSAWEVLFSNPKVWTLLDEETRGSLTSFAAREAPNAV